MNELLEVISQMDEEQQAKLLQVAKDILSQKNGKVLEETEEREDEPQTSTYYDVHQSIFTEEDIQAIVAQFPKTKKWTFDDLQNESIFPPETHVKIELHDYKIYIMGLPTTTHQKILTKISAFLTIHTLKLGEVYVSPVHVKFGDGTVYSPDALYISFEMIAQNPLMITEKSINGAPELVIEVISKSNYKKLREKKKQGYAQNGVLEYWEIRPKKRSVSIETLQNGEYVLLSEATKTGTVKSAVLPDFTLDIETIFNKG
jgi:Uma2 family endonuclease